MKEFMNKARQLAARHRTALGLKPFVAKSATDVGDLYVYSSIGESWWDDSGVTAKKVKDALVELKGVKTLNIYINSEGGDIFEAKAIYSLLERFDAEKVVHVDGLAASAATFIAMVGSKIITASHATWMIHEVRSLAFGRAEEMRAMADLLDLENRTFAETYAKRTKNTVDDVLAWMNAETWMNASDSKERGFTDEVRDPYEEEDDEKVAASAAPVSRIAAMTQEQLRINNVLHDARLARQGQRLNQLGRASPTKRSGQP